MEENKTKTEGGAPAQVTTRNFRHGPDIENFYRFVHENELRRDAKKILEFIFSKISRPSKKKKKKDSKKKLH